MKYIIKTFYVKPLHVGHLNVLKWLNILICFSQLSILVLLVSICFLEMMDNCLIYHPYL